MAAESLQLIPSGRTLVKTPTMPDFKMSHLPSNWWTRLAIRLLLVMLTQIIVAFAPLRLVQLLVKLSMSESASILLAVTVVGSSVFWWRIEK